MRTSIQALLFDFDGLILDTETAELGVWKSIYADYGFIYPQERYYQNIGVWGDYLFDPAGHLHELTRDSLDVEAIRLRHRDESAVIIASQLPREGIPDYLSAARRLGLRTAVASERAALMGGRTSYAPGASALLRYARLR